MATSPHKPPSDWLTTLQKAKTENVSSIKPKVTIQDLVERANDPSCAESQLIPTSPKSIEACFRLGLDPTELVFKPVNAFKLHEETEDLSQIRYEHHEKLRQERLASLIEERKRIIDGVEAPSRFSIHPHRGADGEPTSPGDTSAMIEKEKHKLEVLKRRQERDIQQMLQYEVTRKQLLDKQQKKIEALEARAAELQKTKEEHERAWAVAQRERELQKLAEEQERDREALRIANDRYKREREMQKREAEEAKLRKKEAFQREMERRAKVEEARRETERILAAQEAEVKARKAEMQRRDKERLERMIKESEERAVVNAAKRKKAEERISNALDMNRGILRHKRSEFERREAASEVRRQQMDEERRIAEERKREEERLGEEERQRKYQLALEREEARKQDIRSRAAHKDEVLTEVGAVRKHGNDKRKVERELFNELRRDKVDSIQKQQAYQRQLLLEKIMDENEKTAQLLKQRQAIQEQRKAANMRASLHRNKVNQLMESMKNIKNIEKIAPNGQVDVMALTSQLGAL